MENTERQIRDLEKKLEVGESALVILYGKIGDVIYAAEAENKEGSLAAELLRKIESIDNEADSERERINNILKTVERTNEIEALRKSLMSRIRSIEKDNVSNYETIGRAAYEAYKNGELPADRYADIFTDIVKTMIKISESESERGHFEEQGGQNGLFNKVKSGARVLYLRSAVSGYYRQLHRQYKKAGESICHSELVMNLEAESVEKALKPVRENLEGIEQLEKEDMKLNSETEKLQGSLEDLGVQNNASRTVGTIEDHINELYGKRKSLLREAGELMALNRKDPLAKINDVKSIFKDIDRENSNITAINEEIKRCKAEIEIDRQNREIQALNKKINGFEEKITNYSQEADQLKEKIQAAEENIKRLEDAANDGEKKNG